MSIIPPDVVSLAEDVNAYLPLGRDRERLVDARFVMWLGDGPGPAHTVVQRLRLGDGDVAITVGEVRRLLHGRGRTSATWEIGTQATPVGLEARLSALGMRPFDDPDVIGMVLVGEPQPVPGVVVRRAAAVADYELAERLKLAAFGGAATAADTRRRALARFEDDRESGRGVSFVAFLDDRPVGTARLILCEPGAVFNAGCVVPDARGRGAYRALVAARVDAARRAGAAAVVTQAGRMSSPILARLGFREVTRVRVLVDDEAPPVSEPERLARARSRTRTGARRRTRRR